MKFGPDRAATAPASYYDGQVRQLDAIHETQATILSDHGVLARMYRSMGRLGAESAFDSLRRPMVYQRQFHPQGTEDCYDELGVRVSAEHVNDYGHLMKTFVYVPVATSYNGMVLPVIADQACFTDTDVEEVTGMIDVLKLERDLGSLPGLAPSLTEIIKEVKHLSV